MIPLPSAQELTQGPNAIRLHKKKDRFLFMTYNVKTHELFASQLKSYDKRLFVSVTNFGTVNI